MSELRAALAALELAEEAIALARKALGLVGEEAEPAAPAPPPAPVESPPAAPSPRRRIRRSPDESRAMIRDFAQELGDWFTTAEVAETFEMSRANAMIHIRALVDRGTLVTNGTGPRSPGRRYRFAGAPPPPPTPRNRERGEPVIDLPPAEPVPGTGGGRLPPGVAADLLREFAAQVRWERLPGGHVRVTNRETGESVVIGSTPGKGRAEANIRASLARIGVR